MKIKHCKISFDRTTQHLSLEIQKICFKNNVYWPDGYEGLNNVVHRELSPFLFIEKEITFLDYGDGEVGCLSESEVCFMNNPLPELSPVGFIKQYSVHFDPIDTRPTNPKDAAATTRLDISVFPQTAIVFGALGMTEGGYKYSAYNYREAGVNVSVYYSALQRHIMKYYNGEWDDQKTGVPHLASALSCIAILIDGHVKGNINDDRPPKVNMSELLTEMQASVEHLQKLFPNPKPRCTHEKNET